MQSGLSTGKFYKVKLLYKNHEVILVPSVMIAMRFHLFPCRTQKLSSLAPKILGWQRPGKIGSRRYYAPLAQMVEQLTLNQWVLGSSPRWCIYFFWPVGQAVKTSASHADNTSSNLVPVIIRKQISVAKEVKHWSLLDFFVYGPLAQLVRAPGS